MQQESGHFTYILTIIFDPSKGDGSLLESRLLDSAAAEIPYYPKGSPLRKKFEVGIRDLMDHGIVSQPVLPRYPLGVIELNRLGNVDGIRYFMQMDRHPENPAETQISWTEELIHPFLLTDARGRRIEEILSECGFRPSHIQEDHLTYINMHTKNDYPTTHYERCRP